ncbi:hypothetical protein AB4Z14_21955 [Terrabacter sp. 2TAF16]|uniref:hypothetical protein n=1 Tax=Terrabacter sp. 2TAF16 TaxID=3233008 RepID=UPI003F952469
MRVAATRLSAVALLTVALLGLGMVRSGGAAAGPALVPAHNKNSLIDLAVSSIPDGVRVQAEVRYDDGDPVVDEDVLGVLRDGSSGATSQLKFGSGGTAGQYVTDVPLEAGEWDLEVDAVTYTRGVRTVHFTLSNSGEVSKMTVVAALPNNIERPTTARSRIGMILVWTVVVAFGVLIAFVVVELRRRSKTADV